MTHQKLPRSFYARDTQLVAQALLGKVLVRTWRQQQLIGRITEVESYAGEDDLASHARRGRTPRTEIMYGPAGFSYVYLIYGMYYCLNITSEVADFPAAILIRALEPLSGIPMMQRARHNPDIHQVTTGPGKLTQAFHIDSTLNQVDMTQSSELYVADDGYTTSTSDITAAPRIGVDYAGTSAWHPWRYYLTHSPFVSRKVT